VAQATALVRTRAATRVAALLDHSRTFAQVSFSVAVRLKTKGLRVELDESDERPGAKYYKWEMKGVPLRLEIGPRDLKNNAVTVVRRDTGSRETVPFDSIEYEVENKFGDITRNLFEKAERSLNERITRCGTLEEVKHAISEGIAGIPWCKERECGLAMEEAVGAGILGIPEGELGLGSGICPVCKKETLSMAIMAKTY